MKRLDNILFDPHTRKFWANINGSLVEISGKVANAGKVKSVSVNSGEPVQPDAQGNVNISVEVGSKGADGITPHIDVVTGHWFIGDEDTGVDAHGLQGNSGYTGAVGELEVVEDYTEGGVGKAASAEAVKNMAIKSIPGAGTFADAYEKARANNVVFPWFLRDVDENGNPIEKMIWHNGYRKFVDAIGAEVDGQKNGLTIKVNADCDLLLGTKTYPLTAGENNFSFDTLGWDGSSNITTFKVRDSGKTTDNFNYVEEVDFGWMKISPNYVSISNWNSLKKVKRLDAQYVNWNSGLFNNCPELTEVQVRGYGNAHQFQLMQNSKKIVKADFSGLELSFTQSTNGGLYNSFRCEYAYSPFALEYLDIRGINTAKAQKINNFLMNATALKTLIIGNFTNADTTLPNEYALSGVGVNTDCVLICTTAQPPVLKNCTFAKDENQNDVAQDVHDPALDWLAYTVTENNQTVTKCHFSAIYVPTAALTDYQDNTYVVNGAKGNTGWSVYGPHGLDIIKDIAEYNG